MFYIFPNISLKNYFIKIIVIDLGNANYNYVDKKIKTYIYNDTNR